MTDGILSVSRPAATVCEASPRTNAQAPPTLGVPPLFWRHWQPSVLRTGMSNQRRSLLGGDPEVGRVSLLKRSSRIDQRRPHREHIHGNCSGASSIRRRIIFIPRPGTEKRSAIDSRPLRSRETRWPRAGSVPARSRHALSPGRAAPPSPRPGRASPATRHTGWPARPVQTPPTTRAIDGILGPSCPTGRKNCK